MSLNTSSSVESAERPVRLYRAYGLCIESEVELPGLPRAQGPTDLRVRFGSVEERPTHLDESGRGAWTRKEQACYYLRGVGAFLVTEGREIVVDPDPDWEPRVLQTPVLGPALALALHQRGFLVLHGSGVAVDGHCLSFLGGFGSGKSTMAAIMLKNGFQLISDDVSAVRTGGGRVESIPGYPILKLWPDSATALGLFQEHLPLVHPDHSKRFVSLDDFGSSAGLPLTRLYFLAGGVSVTIEPLGPTESFEILLGNWYGAKYGPDFFRGIDLREHFVKIAEVARCVPARILMRPPESLTDQELQNEIVQAIRVDMRSD